MEDLDITKQSSSKTTALRQRGLGFADNQILNLHSSDKLAYLPVTKVKLNKPIY